jgi:aminoglycoside phosphotransferase (APT) family kinase protein
VGGSAQGRDLEATRARLATWLAARLPGVGRVEVSELRAPGSGFSSETLLFDLVRGEAGHELREALVLRMEPGFPIFLRYDLPRQARILGCLAGAGIPVPRVRWSEADPGPLGTPFYVMERVEGLIPPDSPPYHVAGPLTAMTPAERETLWWSGLDAMAAVHRLDWRAAGLGFLGEDAKRAGLPPLAAQLAEWRVYLDWVAPGGSHPVAGQALAWLEANAPPEHPAALCWGDARLGNLIFRDGRCVAVLDWEMATLGDPVQDLAWWLFFDWHHGEGIGAARLAGFPDRAASVAHWEAATGRPARHLAWYEIFAAFRFSALLARIARHLEVLGLPHAPDFATNNPCARGLAALLEKQGG